MQLRHQTCTSDGLNRCNVFLSQQWSAHFSIQLPLIGLMFILWLFDESLDHKSLKNEPHVCTRPSPSSTVWNLLRSIHRTHPSTSVWPGASGTWLERWTRAFRSSRYWNISALSACQHRCSSPAFDVLWYCFSPRVSGCCRESLKTKRKFRFCWTWTAQSYAAGQEIKPLASLLSSKYGTGLLKRTNSWIKPVV